jgi:hypothetical protein
MWCLKMGLGDKSELVKKCNTAKPSRISIRLSAGLDIKKKPGGSFSIVVII